MNMLSRAHISANHDPERFSDRETPPVRVPFRVPAHRPNLRDDAESSEDVDATVQAAVADATRLFVLPGWPEASAQAGADHIADALARIHVTHHEGARSGQETQRRRRRRAGAVPGADVRGDVDRTGPVADSLRPGRARRRTHR